MHALAVSPAGLVMMSSSRLPVDRADVLAATASSLLSLTQGVARQFQAGGVTETVVRMDRGTLIVMPMRGEACLVVLATPDCELGQVAYEMAVLAERWRPMSTMDNRQGR
ncbi:roadblock/LC7 domain-containing protein [Amycolatopsis sp. K13G38]|uniref:Roadblock/LC7 domain-containing protein n=1 Tax=Amycolatopsis acididurans TaxID=2724524 RepID=A0ABX1J3R7_9PSEU|nr:roadblock/LC7 domain-containing protein [Amycolatopsis acididurans]